MFALENMKGGEIFVPKIPSMRIIDLFDVLVPNVPREIIGIRPGEKLHEVLLIKEEARHSLELEKYFVILPEQKHIFDIKDRFKEWLEKGKKLPPDFYFSSNNNRDWLSKEDFHQIIQKKV